MTFRKCFGHDAGLLAQAPALQELAAIGITSEPMLDALLERAATSEVRIAAGTPVKSKSMRFEYWKSGGHAESNLDSNNIVNN